MTGRRLGAPVCRRLPFVSVSIAACIRAIRAKKIISCSHSPPTSALARCRCSYRLRPPLSRSRRPCRRRRLSTQSFPITLVDNPLATTTPTTPPTKPDPKMFATKAFTIASLILVGAKAFEVSTPANVVQVRTLLVPPAFSGLCSPSHFPLVR